jgi:hypothetical protein
MLFRFAKRFFQKKCIPLVLSTEVPTFPGMLMHKKIQAMAFREGVSQ